MSEKLSYLITIRDGASAVLNRMRGMLGGFRRGIGTAFRPLTALPGIVANMGRGVMGAIGRIPSMLTSLPAMISTGIAGLGIGKAISAAFDIESMETQFKILLGSAERATARIKELQDFSASTPFQLDGIVQASRMLHVFSNGVLGGTESLRLVGDAAAAVGQNIEEVGFWVGRAYSAIQAGQPFGEAAMRLMEMGLLSGSARQELDALTKSGASNEAIWAFLQRELEGFSGGMEELSKTGKGVLSTLKDNAQLALAEFGEAFTEAAKGGMTTLINKIGELRANGTIARWGATAMLILQQVGAVFAWLRDRIMAVAQSNFVGRLVQGFGVVVGIVKQLVDGTTTFGAVLGQVGNVLGASLKLGFATALNLFARHLTAVLGTIPTYLRENFGMITKGQFWSGLGQVIIGSLASVGAFLIKIFTAPLTLVQAGMDTIMAGFVNWLAGLGGAKDEAGVGRLGRYLGLGIQENSFEKNLAEAKKTNRFARIQKEAESDGAGILQKGLSNLDAAWTPRAIRVADVYQRALAETEGPFDTDEIRKNVEDALRGMKEKYGFDFKMPTVQVPDTAAAPPAAPAAVSLSRAASEYVKDLAELHKQRLSSDINVLDRMDWKRNVAAGKTPDEQIAAEAKRMRELLEKIAESEGVK